MWPRPWRAVRAATAIRSRRMVAALAFAKGGLASAPAARSRLCAMAAIASQAAFAVKTPRLSLAALRLSLTCATGLLSAVSLVEDVVILPRPSRR